MNENHSSAPLPSRGEVAAAPPEVRDVLPGQRTRVAIATLGCKVNQYESAAMAECLEKNGLLPAGSLAAADYIIINTCTVTGRTDYQSRQLIRRAQRLNPRAAVIVTGCYAQTAPEVFTRMPGISAVAGNGDKNRIEAIIADLQNRRQAEVTVLGDCSGCSGTPETPGEGDIPFVSRFPGHTRAFLKIQDGCNAFCTYCIVPYARGRSRSIAMPEVISRIERLAGQGYQEVVLTGIHLGAYGEDRQDGSSLAGIVRHVEAHRSIARLRLSSLEPAEINDELLNIMKTAQVVCPHLHIPLQSGDDAILVKMGRKYDRIFFRDLIARVLAVRPDMAVGLDVMAGFPGEDEKAFENTRELIASLPVAYLHVFPYSRRPGTAAARMDDQVSEEDKKRRAQMLRELGTAKRRAFLDRFTGATLPVLVEDRKDRISGHSKGFSHNYLPVNIRKQAAVTANTIVPVKIAGRENDALVGTPDYEH